MLLTLTLGLVSSIPFAFVRFFTVFHPDYRRIPRALSHVYYHPLTQHNTDEIARIFDAITADSTVVQNRQLKIWGRSLTIPESSDRVAKFTFEELCGKPLSAVDYIEITRAFHTIFVLDVPKMDLDQKDMVCLQ